jgi:osmoprotectant transport system substrate-binding protein
VTLGTKNFTEELILGQLYAQALRAKGFTVSLRSNIGASEVVARELAAGRIDGYPEYTGTILSVLARDSRRPPNAAVAYARAAAYERRHGMRLLAMASAEDKNALIAKPAYARARGLRSAADLARIGASLRLA